MSVAEQPRPHPAAVEPRPDLAAEAGPARRAGEGLYRTFWRWHFYAGVLVAPVLCVVAVTGAIYVFKSELERALYADTMFVVPQPSRVPLDTQLAAARASVPEGYAATRFELSADPTRATSVLLVGKDRPFRRVYVNPHTGAVQGEVGDDNFFRVVLDVHRRLFLGSVGRVVVELTACWTIVLLVTGFYLWWPRRAEKLKGVFVPRLRTRPYLVLRDLHTVAGFYLLPVAFLIACTGLLYTLVWGSGYKYAAQKTGAFAIFTNPPASASPPAAKPVPLDRVARTAREQFPDAGGWNVTLPQKAGQAVVVLASGERGPNTQGILVLDHATGEVLGRKTHVEFPAVAQWSNWNYPLHVGSVLGTPTKVVWLVACLVLLALPVTGLWMWWKRRPVGQTGFPRRPDVRRPRWLVGAVVALAVLLPVFGASVLLILAGGWLAGRFRSWRASPPVPRPA